MFWTEKCEDKASRHPLRVPSGRLLEGVISNEKQDSGMSWFVELEVTLIIVYLLVSFTDVLPESYYHFTANYPVNARL